MRPLSGVGAATAMQLHWRMIIRGKKKSDSRVNLSTWIANPNFWLFWPLIHLLPSYVWNCEEIWESRNPEIHSEISRSMCVVCARMRCEPIPPRHMWRQYHDALTTWVTGPTSIELRLHASTIDIYFNPAGRAQIYPPTNAILADPIYSSPGERAFS